MGAEQGGEAHLPRTAGPPPLIQPRKQLASSEYDWQEGRKVILRRIADQLR